MDNTAQFANSMDLFNSPGGWLLLLAVIFSFLGVLALWLKPRQKPATEETLKRLLEETKNESAAELARMKQMVADSLDESRQNQSAALCKLDESLQQVTNNFNHAATELRSCIVEVTRQQQEAKAQSTIQWCDALIGSLGTLRNQIAHSLAEPQTGQQAELTSTQPPLSDETRPDPLYEVDET